MKRIIALSTALMLILTGLQAQKVYSTKTAKITFHSTTPVEDIEAVNSEVEGKLSSTGQMVFMMLVKGFHFPNALMEEHFNENYMESDKFPKSDFKGTLINLKELDFEKDGIYPVKVEGKLTIHGVTKDVKTGGTITIKNGKVSSESKFSIALKDYGIGGNGIGKKIAENINIMVQCNYE